MADATYWCPPKNEGFPADNFLVFGVNGISQITAEVSGNINTMRTG